MTGIIAPFYGPAGDVVGDLVLADASVFGTQYAEWTIGFDGFTYERHNAGAAAQDAEWIDPQFGMDGFEVRATLVSGDVPPGTFATWLPLSASWTWGWTAQPTEKSCAMTIEIRAIGGPTSATATVTLFVAGIA